VQCLEREHFVLEDHSVNPRVAPWSVGVGRFAVGYWMLACCIARSSRRGERAMRGTLSDSGDEISSQAGETDFVPRSRDSSSVPSHAGCPFALRRLIPSGYCYRKRDGLVMCAAVLQLSQHNRRKCRSGVELLPFSSS
jgi:hypothetical protein